MNTVAAAAFSPSCGIVYEQEAQLLLPDDCAVLHAAIVCSCSSAPAAARPPVLLCSCSSDYIDMDCMVDLRSSWCFFSRSAQQQAMLQYAKPTHTATTVTTYSYLHEIRTRRETEGQQP